MTLNKKSLQGMPDVRVGLGILVTRGEKILFGIRKGSHGAGKYQLPGGHLEFGETFEQCAIREVFEETSLKISSPAFFYTTNDFMDSENKHYVTVFMKAECLDGVPRTMEPEKCECWDWISEEEFRKIPEELLFMPVMHLKHAFDRICS